MTDPNKTAILTILDRSGSMATMATDVEAGFDLLMAEQRKVPGEATVTLVQFDHEYEEVYQDLPLKEVPSLTLMPRGSTALYDAIGRAMIRQGERLAALPEEQRPGKVIVFIMTDGHENASQEWTHARVKALIEQQQSVYNWEVVFTSCDLSAVSDAVTLGIRNTASYAGTSVGTAANFASVSRGLTSYRSGEGYVTSDEESA